MAWQDLLNGLFELAGGLFILISVIKLYRDKCTIVEISLQHNTKVPSEFKELKDAYVMNGASCDLRMAIEKPFWTDLKVFYQRASNMLCETKSALLI